MSAASPSPAACPKCGRAGAEGARACARCGLLVARWEGFSSGAPADGGALDAPWARCLAAWDDPAAHDRLLDLATRLDLLPALARRYRERADPLAGERLRRIEALLLFTVEAEARRSPTVAARVLRALGYLSAAALLAAAAWLLLLAVRRHPGLHPAPGAVAVPPVPQTRYAADYRARAPTVPRPPWSRSTFSDERSR